MQGLKEFSQEEEEEYQQDRYAHMLDLEKRRTEQRGTPHPAEHQRQDKMEFIRDFCASTQCPVSVAFRAVDYLDRYSNALYAAETKTIDWQLAVLCACTFIAIKMEDFRTTHSCKEVLSLAFAERVEKRDMLCQESIIMNALHYELETITAPEFIEFYVHRAKLGGIVLEKAVDLCMKTLGCASFYQFRPSMIAMSCIYAANVYLTKSADIPPSFVTELFSRAQGHVQFIDCVTLLGAIQARQDTAGLPDEKGIDIKLKTVISA